jgi:hypothetical protein
MEKRMDVRKIAREIIPIDPDITSPFNKTELLRQTEYSVNVTVAQWTDLVFPT